MSTYTKMSRRDYVREGFCPTLGLVFYAPFNIIFKSLRNDERELKGKLCKIMS